jgi:hypothetical protein
MTEVALYGRRRLRMATLSSYSFGLVDEVASYAELALQQGDYASVQKDGPV